LSIRTSQPDSYQVHGYHPGAHTVLHGRFPSCSSPGIEPKRASVEAIVHDRFTGLGQNLRIAMAKKAKESA
jgi:hypothetical protein